MNKREEAIKEGMADIHVWLVEHLPDKLASKMLDFLGYELVFERPRVLSFDEDAPHEYRVLKRWYLQRDGNFITGSKELYRKTSRS